MEFIIPRFLYNPRFPEVIHNTHQELKDMLIQSLHLLFITYLKAPIKHNSHIKDIYLHITIIMEYHVIIIVIGDPGDST